LVPLTMGRIASYYYLHHSTVSMFNVILHESDPGVFISSLMMTLCNAKEYEELPVRHNEDKINSDLAEAIDSADLSHSKLF